MFDLSDRVAVVTGGSRGLGRERVLGLASDASSHTTGARLRVDRGCRG